MQLLHEDGRWWLMTVYWHRESKDHPIPAEYLPQK